MLECNAVENACSAHRYRKPPSRASAREHLILDDDHGFCDVEDCARASDWSSLRISTEDEQVSIDRLVKFTYNTAHR